MTYNLSPNTARLLPAAMLFVLVHAVVADAVTVVATCGQTVTGSAELRANLDCSTAGGEYALTLAPGATLRLNGFTLVAPHNGVRCDGACRLEGPGTIGASEIGPGNSCTAGYGVWGSARITKVYLEKWGTAAWGDRMRAKDVTVVNGCNGLGASQTIRVTDSTLDGLNGAGIFAPSVRVLTAIVTNSRGGGVVGERLRVKGSTITGNLVDLASPNLPRVRGSICATSSLVYPREDGIDYWDVCEAPITTTTTSLVCPATTTIPACVGTYCSSGGLCAPGQACQLVGDTCGCVGPPVPCGDLPNSFSGNVCAYGECPAGMQCFPVSIPGTCSRSCGCYAASSSLTVE